MDATSAQAAFSPLAAALEPVIRKTLRQNFAARLRHFVQFAPALAMPSNGAIRDLHDGRPGIACMT
jgi:hypothetical protein